MRTRGKMLLVAAGLAAAVVAGLFWRSAEPRYEGRRLSHWVTVFDGNHRQEEIQRAVKAISSSGTNALPFLIEWIQYESSAHPLRTKVNAMLDQHINFSALYFFIAGRRAHLAVSVCDGFRTLGARATPAIPELERLMNDSSRPESGARAALALAYIGTNGLTALLKVIDTPGHGCRYFALWALPMIGERGLEAVGETGVPELIRCLGDTTDPKVPFTAATALGYYKSVPLVVSTLASCLTSNNSSLRRSAAESLGNIGARASSALPALTNALLHPDPDFRGEAKDAIAQIARDARTNTPVMLPK